MTDPDVPDRPHTDDSETVRAPVHDDEPPQRGKKSFASAAVIIAVAVMVGALLVALALGLLD
jgi:hypothetical protein